jgi:hypothetical protein
MFCANCRVLPPDGLPTCAGRRHVDRFRYRSPPFLNPVDAAWNVMRENEQVPATK